MDIEYFELREDYAIFMIDDTTRLRSAVCIIHIYISLRLNHRPKTLVTDHLIKGFLRNIYIIYF